MVSSRFHIGISRKGLHFLDKDGERNNVVSLRGADYRLLTRYGILLGQ